MVTPKLILYQANTQWNIVQNKAWQHFDQCWLFVMLLLFGR